jgi:hypothetical protein
MFFVLIPSWIQAQPHAHWQYIHTPHYDIYFLSNMAREAQRVAGTLESLYIPASKSLQASPRRHTVVLRSERVEHNGFTTPSNRLEIFTFPSQDYNFMYNSDWISFVATHELRHTAQFRTVLQNYFFPIPMWTTSSLFTPDWLFEGDAVGIETALTAGGRGRIPNFLLHYKVNLLERGGFGYYKNVHGSLKDFMPNHYRLGYVLTTYLRRHYRTDIIRQLFERKGFLDAINPWVTEQKIKKLTGKTVEEIFQDANEELKTLWGKQLEGLQLTPFTKINRRTSGDYINYIHPHSTQDGIIVLKSGLAFHPHFIQVDSQGNEKKIINTLLDKTDVRFSMAQQTLYWIETCPPWQWKDVTYTALKSYNLATKTYQTLAANSRYNVVAASPNDTKLAVVESNTSYEHHLIILHAQTGEVLQVLPNPSNNYYLTPSWSMDNRHLVAIKQAHNKSTLTLIDTYTGAEEDVLPPTEELIGNPVLHEPYIYYASAYSGIDNIYALDLKTRRRFQVTSSQYGGYNPALSADGQWLFYNDFSKGGMEAVKIKLDPSRWIPLEKVEQRSFHYYAPIVEQEKGPISVDLPSQQRYPIKDYHLLGGLSLWTEWPPKLVLKDIFDTIRWELIILKNLNLYIFDSGPIAHPTLATKFIYKGWYPILSFESSVSNLLSNRRFRVNKNKLAITIPFKWSAREYIYKTHLKTSTLLYTVLALGSRWQASQQYNLSFQRAMPKSPRDIYSPWAQQLRLAYCHTLYEEPLIKAITATIDFYFPGLFKNHGLQLTHQAVLTFSQPIQEEKVAEDYYQNLSRPSSLRKNRNLSSPITINQTASILYALPLCYPDIGWGKLLYLKQIWIEPWYQLDYTLHAVSDQFIGLNIGLQLAWVKLSFTVGYSPKKGAFFTGF